MSLSSLQADVTLDCKGLACPMPIIRTKKTIESMDTGRVLAIEATDQGSLADLQAWTRSMGHQYLGTIKEGTLQKHYVRKSSPDEGASPRKHAPTTPNDQLLAMMDAGESAFVILDVREPAEYAFGHIPGAVSVPLGKLETGIEELRSLYGGAEIHVVCRSGTRSDLACRLLAEYGFDRVWNVFPGMSEWEGPVERWIG
ncbi:sulfurtransferase TusA family protein [Paenibacillus sp. LHD-117]|uniref:sulfurtransferase TusA family protein n=1 Tax=Paenibacillus sp. LHD-117 TaxID=3071412 RepID=UPI0027DEAE71|nr:sulfurtransferase TusA family protein [Paenibacillus sp. LHD-117]MDQ6422924.1 sulfurtransferase TusA family protein [Paenibacillus sp. LHD-117]